MQKWSLQNQDYISGKP